MQIGAYTDVQKAAESKNLRRGKGKMRNRRYVMRRGPLVIFKNEGAGLQQAMRNIPGVDLCHVERLNLLQVPFSFAILSFLSSLLIDRLSHLL